MCEQADYIYGEELPTEDIFMRLIVYILSFYIVLIVYIHFLKRNNYWSGLFGSFLCDVDLVAEDHIICFPEALFAFI